MLTKLNLTMRARLIAAFFLVALIPMSLLAFLNSRSTRQALIDDANQALFAVASQTAASLDVFINSNIEAVRTEAQLPAIKNYLSLPNEQLAGSPEELEVLALLQTLSTKDNNITSYALLDSRGFDLVDTSLNEIGIDKSDREYYTHFLDNPDTRKTYVSPVQFYGGFGEASLYFSSPIYATGGEFMGVLRARYSAEVLQDLVAEKNNLAGQGSFGVLFDEHHIHLAHGVEPQVNYLPIITFDDALVAELRDNQRLPDILDEDLFIMELTKLETHLSNPEEERFFEAEDVATGELVNQVAIAAMENQPWLVTFFQPQEIFLAPVQAQTNNTLLLLGLFAVAAVLIAFAIGQLLGRPIIKLTGTVSQFAEGNLEARSEIESEDEIGVLAKSFNSMAEQLGNSLTGLENRQVELESEISERQRAEGALRKSEERYRSISDLTSDYIYSVDVAPDGDLQLNWSTEAFSRFTGYTAEELAERGGWTSLVHPEDREDFDEKRNRLLESGDQDAVEYRIITKDGKIRWLRDFRRSTLDEEGKSVVRLLGAAQDITAQKKADQELKGAKDSAEAANRAKSAFLANMSHELRTPLNAILGFTQLMARDGGLNPQQREHLGIVSRGGEHLLTLINDILEMSKIEAGRTQLNNNSFDFYRLLDDIEDMLQLRTKEEGLLMLFERTPEVPQYIRADERKLRQVLINLLSNAIKFTKEGGISLRVRFDNGEKRLYFEIEDSGPGIAQDEIDFLFEAFVQTSSGESTLEGTGLGLPISQQFVQLMGSKITVSTKLGQGSIFKFDMLMEAADASKVAAKETPRQVIGLEPGQPRYRILIVEDRLENRKLLIELLEPLGFELREAVNGQEAIEMWRSWEPHLIWMDMRMPVMDGYEATRQIRSTTNGPETVIIALTASAFEENRAMSLEAGAYDFVRKPFRSGEIFDKITKHLGVRFIYDDEPVETERKKPIETSQLTPAALASLPSDWVAELHRAASRADSELILELVERIRLQEPDLAGALVKMVDNFRFEVIMDITSAQIGV
ncbi:MAG: response regulator [Chloroflexi bacterium]|nr:response regulator [Chloroflexota bacterium]